LRLSFASAVEAAATTAAGVDTALPAVDDSEIGAITLFSLNILKAMIPVNAVQIKVNSANVKPPDNTEKLKNSAKLIPAPKEKAKKGMSMVSPGRKNSDILGSTFPNIIPILKGKSTETKEMIGKVAPRNPTDIKANNAP